MLELRGVNKAYGSNHVVRDVDLNVEQGEFFSLLGPSGCGKTTILRMIAGIVAPDSGAILLAGTEVTEAPINKRDLTLVFQNYALFPHMTVADNVAFGLTMRGVPRAEIQRRVREALDVVKLPGLDGRKPSQLSGGQQQRVALARAIVVRPRLLLLDEPLSNLDAALRDQMRWHLKEVQQQTGITTVLVTHDIQEAFALSDRIAVMNAGRIEQIGSPHDIYTRPTSSFIAAFTGDINLLEGAVEGDEAGGFAVRLNDGLRVLVSGEVRHQAGARAKLLIRPEAIALASPVEPDGHTRDENVFEARIDDATFLGAQVRVSLRVGDLPLIASVPGHGFEPYPASRTISIPRAACVLIA